MSAASVEQSSQHSPSQAAFDIEQFLAAEESKGLLRLTTAGSVDDGKSTLIGRLLHDAKGAYEDQLKSAVRGGTIDFSLLTDGLRAEREQGITIDVAYRYFATIKRKFILADTPGHEQYTRNMATGASTADAAVVLVDAEKGVRVQTRRHTHIVSLLGVQNVILAVNKMDRIGYDKARFEAIAAEFVLYARKLGVQNIEVIPVAALTGVNVVTRGIKETPWYTGRTLLDSLEGIEAGRTDLLKELRFPIQLVNNLLQWRLGDAWRCTERFVVNTTIGLLGIYDPASVWGLPPAPADFGQTLAVWGLEEGPYLVIPFLGPSDPRDATGLLADFLIESEVLPGSYFFLGTYVVATVNWRGQNLDNIREAREAAIDYYTAVRSAWLDHRRRAIGVMLPPDENKPDTPSDQPEDPYDVDSAISP